jgi:hypothetical protein
LVTRIQTFVFYKLYKQFAGKEMGAFGAAGRFPIRPFLLRETVMLFCLPVDYNQYDAFFSSLLNPTVRFCCFNMESFLFFRCHIQYVNMGNTIKMYPLI